MKGVLFLVCLFSLAKAEAQEYSFKPEFSTIIDSSKTESLVKACSRDFPEYFIPVSISLEEVEKLETNFRKILDVKSDKCCAENDSVKDLAFFAYQYAGIIYNGKKCIYINAFPAGTRFEEHALKWKTNPVHVFGGGNYYWGVMYDLSDNDFFFLAFNGRK